MNPYHHPPLRSERLQLRYFEAADAAQTGRLLSDLSVQQYYLPVLPEAYNSQGVVETLQSFHDGRRYMLFTILRRDTCRPVGLCNIDDINWPNRNAEIGIGISDPDARGCGYASEALGLLLDYLFNEMGMHHIRASVIDGNTPSLKLFERLGFKTEGRRRAFVYRNGDFRDMHLLGLLAEEWSQHASTGRKN